MIHKRYLPWLTLVEILSVVIAMSFFAGIVILSVNPAKQFADAHNARRRKDVTDILNAVYRYRNDHQGVLPASITLTATEICHTGKPCDGRIDLSEVTQSEKYLRTIPHDPYSDTPVNGTGYTIQKTAQGRVSVGAPHAEQGVLIHVSR